MITVVRDGPFASELPTDNTDDLVARAARSLLNEYPRIVGPGSGLNIRLSKLLPVAAGIGGGSADAAATLRAILALAEMAIEPNHLRALALALGADVPVCLAGTPSVMRGIGEDLTPFPALPDMGVVLVNPGQPLSTPAVFARYGELSAGFSQQAEMPSAFENTSQLVANLAGHANDLSAAACSVMPVISTLLAALESMPGCRLARMSGSGATCFGLFDTVGEAQIAQTRVGAENADWWSAAGRLLSAPPELQKI